MASDDATEVLGARATAGAEAGLVRIGTWNVSHWTPGRAATIAYDVATAILAVQETHLAALPLDWAKTTAVQLGLRLHHGAPAQAVGDSLHGKACGVGFVAAGGVALSREMPSTSTWRMLHAERRLHVVSVPRRPDLPHGLLLVSVYAPLQTQESERRRFNAAFAAFTHELDLQRPTLLLGDFNGTLGGRNPCPLLAQLLGPGGAWVDVQATFATTPLEPTFHSTATTRSRSGASRIDLILASRSALSLVRRIEVLSHIQDGGHSPVVVSLRLQQPLALCWQSPRPRPPALLLQSSADLQQSLEWGDLIERWSASPAAQAVLDPGAQHDADSLSTAIVAALHHLVDLAGGWSSRASHRRAAYDSAAIRLGRRRLRLLQQLDVALRPLLGPVLWVGAWPRAVLELLSSLARCDLTFDSSSASALRDDVAAAIRREQTAVQLSISSMRRERHKRWKDTLPTTWRERPAVVYHWLQSSGVPWGTFPILREDGLQCCTPSEVDAAVQGFWVDQVLRQHAAVDEVAAWENFVSSRFGAHIPSTTWPRSPWDGRRVKTVIRGMRDAAAPGFLGVPIAVWKSLPDEWYAAMAKLFTLVEDAGRWPREWLDAYVTMIPKAAGGTRPRDQRPITVLEVLYRVWSKGVIVDWGPVLQREFLGPWAMGFRAGSGTLHLAQLLTDLITLQHRRSAELWLASFDVEKAFDSLPWWAVFRVLLQVGIDSAVVNCFAAFYRELRRRFRYGAVDGSTWSATNGLAQGCPASPDLLNVLLEAFHRWAAAAGLGVLVVDNLRIASASFADDVALIADSQAQLEQLIAAYLEWCGLLGVRVTKVQLWCNAGVGRPVAFAGGLATTQKTFKIVGVQLGADTRLAASLHFERRLQTALEVTARLRALALPASLAALLWRTTVLPRALYGCEFHVVPVSVLRDLQRDGLAMLQCKPPLALACWRAPEIVMGLPLGDTALRHPVEEAHWRQLRWAQLVINLPGLVGTVHRFVASTGATPLAFSPAITSVLSVLGWSFRRNLSCLRAQSWPQVSSEASYPGELVLTPDDSTLPDAEAFYTDGSLTVTSGGAAAVSMATHPELATTLYLSAPRSSTHCELVALILALRQSPAAVLTDSLASLAMLRGWDTWSSARTLACPDRVEIREALYTASLAAVPARLEKVKAHDDAALARGWPKAVGNDLADTWARRAAASSGGPFWIPDSARFSDPVELLDATGAVVLDLASAFRRAWWQRSRKILADRRSFMAELYPPALQLDWEASCGIFRRPSVVGRLFVHAVTPAVIKWISRVRAGCLAAGDRLHRQGQLRSSPCCPCCPAPLEDDLHVLLGCPGTGSADWAIGLREVWQSVASSTAPAAAPPSDWIAQHRLPLVAALIPSSLSEILPAVVAPTFARRLHRALAIRTAHFLWRREALRYQAAPSDAPAAPLRRRCILPPERQLSPGTLRRLEIERRQALSSQAVSSAPLGNATPAPPTIGDQRRRWLRDRLVALLASDTVVRPPNLGATAVELTELFERVVGEPFSDTPGVPLTSRVRALAKVMGNLTRAGEGQPPLAAGRRRNLVTWSRAPRQRVDVEAWRCRTELEESSHQRPQRRQLEMEDADRRLGSWIRDHPYLVPAEIDVGESGMALLLLWEVDHGCSWPTLAEEHDRSGILSGFTRRLKRRVAEDPVLSHWLRAEYVQRPLSIGLADTHHHRWTVRVRPPHPDEPQGWWLQFTDAWRKYLLTQQHHLPPVPIAQPDPPPSNAQAPADPALPPVLATASRRPRSQNTSRAPRSRPVTRQPAPVALPQTAAAPASQGVPQPGIQRRSTSPPPEEPPRKRQTTLAAWFQPRVVPMNSEASSSSSTAATHRHPGVRHGRAKEGPPT